jgi:release factor glutamine methyltransferase
MLQNPATLKQIRLHLLEELRQIYTENESDSITRLILEHVGYQLSDAIHDPGRLPAPSVLEQIRAIVTDMQSGQPIQYVLGECNFGDLKIKVNRDVLIPRPETEELVEHIKTHSPSSPEKIIDLGTGSGCIALALKQIFPDAEIWGVDISRRALALAEENGRNNGLQVSWRELDLLEERPMVPGKPFSLVVSNPPYVMHSERALMARHVRDFEPESALFVTDEDPLIFYRAIASFCKTHLADSGELWVEINEQLGKETAKLLKKEGFGWIEILRDIHEKERYIHARK